MSKRPDDLHAWAADLDTLRAQVWTRMLRGVRDRRASARYPTLCTVSATGRPHARTVVLRAVDVQAGQIEIHTDIHSAKVTDLRASPWASVHVWDQSARVQTRLEALADLRCGRDVRDEWARLPPSSRAAYGRTPPTGRPIADGLAYQSNADPDSLVVIRLTVMSMDILHLGPAHRRATFDRSDGWAGQWLAP